MLDETSLSKTDLSKKDWIDVHREGRQLNSLPTSLISKFLEIAPERILSNNKSYKGAYQRHIVIVVFDDFLKLHNYKIINYVGICDNDYYALKKEDIEISPDKFKRCITEGYMFVARKDFKFVLEFDKLYGNETWGMNLFYRPEDEEKTLQFLTDLEKYAKDNNYLKNAKVNPELEHIKITTRYSWNDIILPDKVTKEIITNVDNLFNNIDKYKNMGVKFKRGIILQGVPGTGKTMIGKVLCQTTKCSFLWVTPRFLTRSIDVASVCELARELAPTILFLEDIDLYGGSRATTDNRGILGELMNQLDGIVENDYIVVVATTNNVEHVEKALRNRPGRFDRIIEIPKPETNERLRLLKLYTKDYDTTKLNFNSIVKHTEGYTGAHIRELINVAVIDAVDSSSKGTTKVVLKHSYFQNNFSKVKYKEMRPLGFTPRRDEEDDCDEPIPSRFD